MKALSGEDGPPNNNIIIYGLHYLTMLPAVVSNLLQMRLKRYLNLSASTHFMNIIMIKLININDLDIDNMMQVTINNENYLVAKINDTFYVTTDMCTHEDAELTNAVWYQS